MNQKLRNYAIILAAGSGKRFGNDLPKQFIKIGGKEILAITLEAFQNSNLIDEIIIATNPSFKEKTDDIINLYKFNKVKKIISGGETRKDSSYNAIFSIEDEEAKVLIHDCARPFVSQKTISDSIKALDKFNAITTAIPLTDTIIKTDSNIISQIPNRKEYMRVQTPQGFKLSIIKKAHKLAKSDSEFTDDCGLIINQKLSKIHIIEGNSDNIKITYPQDIYIAEKIFSQHY